MTILSDIWRYLVMHPEFALVGGVTLIQIAPIQVNPWSAVLRLIRGVLVGGLEDSLAELKRDFEEETVTNKRWNILDFANSCRNNRKHSKDEWRHVIDQLKEYETYTEEHHIDNGVIEEEAKYLRKLYQERCEKNDFL